jgi:mannose-1-phosphate guanylyltransferase/phosphomannomutase
MRAVIMAGGQGVRLRPLTNDRPKPMVHIIDKPVLQCIIELLREYEIREIAITLGYKKDIITDYFGDGSNFGVKLTYFIEETPLGTAGGVKAAEDFVTDDFLVLSGDSYTDIDLKEFVAFHKKSKAQITLASKYLDNTAGFGVLECDYKGQVTKFVEKPEGNSAGIVNMGLYAMQKQVLNLIPENTPFDFGRQLLPSLVGSLYTYQTDRYWSDIGTLPAYYLTNYHVATMGVSGQG